MPQGKNCSTIFCFKDYILHNPTCLGVHQWTRVFACAGTLKYPICLTFIVLACTLNTYRILCWESVGGTRQLNVFISPVLFCCILFGVNEYRKKEIILIQILQIQTVNKRIMLESSHGRKLGSLEGCTTDAAFPLLQCGRDVPCVYSVCVAEECYLSTCSVLSHAPPMLSLIHSLSSWISDRNYYGGLISLVFEGLFGRGRAKLLVYSN